MKHIVVLGAGIVGLSAANVLIDRGFKVTVVADKYGKDTLSGNARVFYQLCACFDQISWSLDTSLFKTPGEGSRLVCCFACVAQERNFGGMASTISPCACRFSHSLHV